MKKDKTMRVSQAEQDLLQMFRAMSIGQQVQFESALMKAVDDLRRWGESCKPGVFAEKAAIQVAMIEEFADKFHALFRGASESIGSNNDGGLSHESHPGK